MSTRAMSIVMLYKKAVEKRTGKPYHPKIADLMGRPDVKALAKKLKSTEVRTYTEAVFNKYPADWCEARFKVKYPPLNMAFSMDNLDVMKEYIDRGRVHPV